MREMNARKVIVTMVDGTVFHGSTNIGNSRRISDHLKKDESMFLVLFDAVLGNHGERQVYFINRNHILWVKPDDMANGTQSEDILTIAIDSETGSG
ncbi:MAG: hypothetical protein WAW37_05275 [Syntrophobacteraceae bacterium]